MNWYVAVGIGGVGVIVAVPVKPVVRWVHMASAENVKFFTGVQRVITPSSETMKFGSQVEVPVVDVVDVVSVHDGSMLASHVLLESVVDVVDVVVVINDSEGFDVPESVEVPLSLGGVASAVDGDD